MRVALLAALSVLPAACVIDSPKPSVSRFEVMWSLAAGECADVGAQVVRVRMVEAGVEELSDDLPCADKAGVTHAVQPDTAYGVLLVALDADGVELGRSETRTARSPRSGTAVLEAFVIDTGP